MPGVFAAWISVPGTSATQTAGDVASWIPAMIAELAASPDNRRTIICLDEFLPCVKTSGRVSLRQVS
jgi:hypothetical protein